MARTMIKVEGEKQTAGLLDSQFLFNTFKIEPGQIARFQEMTSIATQTEFELDVQNKLCKALKLKIDKFKANIYDEVRKSNLNYNEFKKKYDVLKKALPIRLKNYKSLVKSHLDPEKSNWNQDYERITEQDLRNNGVHEYGIKEIMDYKKKNDSVKDELLKKGMKLDNFKKRIKEFSENIKIDDKVYNYAEEQKTRRIREAIYNESLNQRRIFAEAIFMNVPGNNLAEKVSKLKKMKMLASIDQPLEFEELDATKELAA